MGTKVVTARTLANNHLLELLGTTDDGEIKYVCIEPGCRDDNPFGHGINLDLLYDFSWKEESDGN